MVCGSPREAICSESYCLFRAMHGFIINAPHTVALLSRQTSFYRNPCVPSISVRSESEILRDTLFLTMSSSKPTTLSNSLRFSGSASSLIMRAAVFFHPNQLTSLGFHLRSTGDIVGVKRSMFHSAARIAVRNIAPTVPHPSPRNTGLI
jgi:hypothetical protein